jgi:hypothetical protein
MLGFAKLPFPSRQREIKSWFTDFSKLTEAEMLVYQRHFPGNYKTRTRTEVPRDNTFE